MKTNMLQWLMVMAAVLLAATGAPAVGDDGYQAYDLGEVFVQSEQMPAVQEMSINHSITAEEIEATNSHTVAEALQHVPGIRISTVKKNQSLAYIHGLSQARALVLIDGVPYYETRYGYLDLNQISVDNIARIEVIKGAPSVLYGTNDVAGVINIITRQGTEEMYARVIGEVGPNVTHREAVTHGWAHGPLNYWVSYDHQQSDGWEMADDYAQQLATVRYTPGGNRTLILEDGGRRENSDYDQHSVWARFGIAPSAGAEYFLNAHYVTKEKGDPPSIYGGSNIITPPAFSQVYNRMTKYNNWGMDLSGQQSFGDNVTVMGKIYYHDHIDQYTSYTDTAFNRPTAVSDYKDKTLGGYVSGEYRAADWDVIRAALHYEGDNHRERADEYLPFEKWVSHTGSVSMENEWNRVRDLSVVLGVSYDWFAVRSASGTNNNGTQYDRAVPSMMREVNPMIGATYALNDSTKLFGSIARKTRFPTLDQIFSSRGGNPDISAESAFNYTVGASHAFSRYANVEVSGFHHHFSDFISREGNPWENPNYLNRNIATVRMWGGELNGELFPLADFPDWEDLALRVGYTYNHARDASPERVTEYVTNVPQHSVNLGLHITVPRAATTIDVTGRYMGEVFTQLPTSKNPLQAVQQVSEYFTADVRVGQPIGDNLEAYAAVNNLCDRAYEADYGLPAPGRSYTFGLSWKF